MIWKLDPETGRYFQTPGKNQWVTLADCLLQNAFSYPISVKYKDAAGIVHKLTFVECYRVALGLEYVLHRRDADKMYTPYFNATLAKQPSFKLIPLIDYDNRMCQCDWRQVVLVTGCRCGRKDYL